VTEASHKGINRAPFYIKTTNTKARQNNRGKTINKNKGLIIVSSEGGNEGDVDREMLQTFFGFLLL
jgi:hypothetical protein